MNMTVKELAAELNVSKQTIHRTIQKRNIGTIADGNKILLDDTAQKAIKEDLQNRTTHNETSENVTADDLRTSANDTWNDTERHADDTADDYRTIYIDALKIQIEDLKSQIENLKSDKQFLQDRLTVAEHNNDVLTKERQTILAELLSLRGQSKITTAASAAETKAAPEPHPQKQRQQFQQAPKKRTLSERIRDFFK